MLDHYGNDLAAAREALEDGYHGCHPSFAKYIQQLTEETMQISDLRGYINYEAMARDAELGGEIFVIRLAHNQVHVFSSQ